MNCSVGVDNELSALSLGDWVWDCQWLTDDPCCRCEHQLMSADGAGDGNQLNAITLRDRYHLAAALGHNSLALCCWWTMAILQRIYCSESCILYLFLVHLLLIL